MRATRFTVFASVFWLWMLSWSALAHADVWGFVDEHGVAHFAAEPLDERYELYSATPAKLIAFFDVSPNYKQVKHLLREASRAHQIDYELLQALIATESGFDALAISPRGAVGLMQLMPATAEIYGVTPGKHETVAHKLKDPRINIRAGCLYLRDLMARFPGRLDLALAAYNSGLKAVRRAGNKVPPIKETRNFVKTVMQMYAVLKPPHMKPGARPVPLQDQSFSRNKSN